MFFFYYKIFLKICIELFYIYAIIKNASESMERIVIKVYSNLNNIEDNNEYMAIKSNNIIKYIDFDNNKMKIDIDNNIIERENNDYYFLMDFTNNVIIIKIKKLHKEIVKNIKTLNISKEKKKYTIKYLLTDENIINEYYVKF